MSTDPTPDEHPDDASSSTSRVTKGAIAGLVVAVIAIGGGLYASQSVGTAPEVADALGAAAAQISGPIEPALLKNAECEKTKQEDEYHCVLKDGTDLNVVYEENVISRRLIGAKLDRSPASDAEVTELVNRELKALEQDEAKTMVCSTSIGFLPDGSAEADITGFLCVEKDGKEDSDQTRFLQFAADGSLLRDYKVALGGGASTAPAG